MKKYTLLFLLMILTTATFAQSKKKKKKKSKNKIETLTTASGLQYQILHDAGAKKALPGDKITVHYVGTLTNDTVFDSSRGRDQPFTFELGAGRVIKAWEEGFKFLGVGDKAVFTVPPDLGYGDQATGKIPAKATLIFDVEVLSIQEGIRPWDISGKDTLTTESGLKYVKVEEQPNALQAENGDIVKVHYSGFLTDGKKFDSSVERGDPFEFKLGEGRVIRGWEEGIALLKEGEKAKLIIPYELGYGDRESGPIPAKSTLIFDVELVQLTKIEKPKPYAVEGKEVHTTESGLKYIVVESANTAIKPSKGKSVVVHYTGYLEDGSIFDSSVERGQPFQFPVGENKVIPGWEEAMPMMSQGDKFRLIIPPNLAYGAQGFPPQIPANSTITFDVELILVYETPKAPGGHDGHDHGSHEGHNH